MVAEYGDEHSGSRSVKDGVERSAEVDTNGTGERARGGGGPLGNAPRGCAIITGPSLSLSVAVDVSLA